jgi:hypothetical protein
MAKRNENAAGQGRVMGAVRQVKGSKQKKTRASDLRSIKKTACSIRVPPSMSSCAGARTYRQWSTEVPNEFL